MQRVSTVRPLLYQADVAEQPQVPNTRIPDFARGDTGEVASIVNIEEVLQRFKGEAEKLDKSFNVKLKGDPSIVVRPTAFSRLMSNLVLNALRHGDKVEVRVKHRKNALVLEVHDNGPGIAEDLREEVFKPFVRLDDARNQDETGTGLGLAISQDIVHTHGGEISLKDSDLGGLMVVVKLPA